jgi:hypothetical protein
MSITMRQARSRQFDPQSPPWIHAISRCVRRAFLCGDGYDHRKSWIERRLGILARCCAVDVGAYAIMSNHIHLVLRPVPERAARLDEVAVARAWWHLRHDVDPATGCDRYGTAQVPPQTQIDALAADPTFVSTWRQRLGTLSWFMKELKEPLARRANREDDCTGTFWEGRFKSIPLLDLPAIVACMAYVDLNPIRAQLASSLETSDFTSVKARVLAHGHGDQAATAAKTTDAARTSSDSAISYQSASPDDLTATTSGRRPAALAPSATMSPTGRSPEHAWLLPVQQILRTYDDPGDPGISLPAYLRLVEATGRLMRADKRGAIAADARSVLDLIDIDPDVWLATVAKPKGLRGSALGRAAALATEAARRGLAWVQARCVLCARGLRVGGATG